MVRRRPAWGLLTATGLSVTGNAVVAVLVPWLVLSRTGSAAQAGLVATVALAAAVPALLLGGPLIDRWGRRRVSVGADILSAAAVAALPLLDRLVGLSLVSTLALVGIGALFDGPGAAARETARPQVAALSQMPVTRMNARGEALDGAGQVAGPALAGVGLGAVGASGSLWVAAGMFLLAAVTTRLSLPRDPAARPAAESHVAAALSGIRSLWRDPTLRAVALLGMIAVAFIAPLPLILIAHLEPTGRGAALGAVLAAFSVGAIIGALASGRLADRLPRGAATPTVLLPALLVTAGVGFAAMSTLPATTGLVILTGLTGLAVGPISPVLAGLVQQHTPPPLLARVISTTWALSLLAGPAAVSGTGILLEVTGPATGLAVIALGCVLTAAYGRRARGLRVPPPHGPPPGCPDGATTSADVRRAPDRQQRTTGCRHRGDHR